MSRVLLICDEGEKQGGRRKGYAATLRCYGAVRLRPGDVGPDLSTERQRAARLNARRWWLVECENAKEARQLIFWNGAPPSGLPAGRIVLRGGSAVRDGITGFVDLPKRELPAPETRETPGAACGPGCGWCGRCS